VASAAYANLNYLQGDKMENHVEIRVLKDFDFQTTDGFDDLTFQKWTLKEGACG